MLGERLGPENLLVKWTIAWRAFGRSQVLVIVLRGDGEVVS